MCTRDRNRLQKLSRYHTKGHTLFENVFYNKNPNTIYTSEAAATNVETADFSEAEDSTDSGDDDDRLSWQDLSKRGCKRTSPRATRVPTMKQYFFVC
jgi:hypothetical protein